MTDKEKYFKELDSMEQKSFPITDQEIMWFEEWLETSEEGKKMSAEADKSYHEMTSRHSCDMMFLVFWLRDLRKNSDGDEMTIKVKFIDKKNFLFSTDNVKMDKSPFGGSRSISL